MRTSLVVIVALFASVQAQAVTEPVAKDSALEKYDPTATDKNEAKAEAPPAKIPAFNEPAFSAGTHPSSAGLVQLQGEPSTGVTYSTKGYGPNGGVEKLSFFDPKVAKAHTSFYSQFASGMNGDEDLGEDITMKGDKFHFAQNLAQAEPVVYSTKGYGANGGVEKLSFFDPKIAKAHTSFYSQLRADPEAPQTTPAGMQRLGAWAKYDTKGYGPVEKTSFFDPKVAKAHTSFYSQFASGMNGDEDLGEDITMKGDKFHFAQAEPVVTGEPEKVVILDPKIAKAHTTFYNNHGGQRLVQNKREYEANDITKEELQAKGRGGYASGSEDLGQTITMGGVKFSFGQRN